MGADGGCCCCLGRSAEPAGRDSRHAMTNTRPATPRQSINIFSTMRRRPIYSIALGHQTVDFRPNQSAVEQELFASRCARPKAISEKKSIQTKHGTSRDGIKFTLTTFTIQNGLLRHHNSGTCYDA